MVRLLFENFLESDDAFRACVQYWEALFADISAKLGQPDEWEPWVLREYANGRPHEDRWNPIFDRRSKRLDRAFRITQHPIVSDLTERDLGTAAWLYHYDDEWEGTDVPADELYISLILSDESAELTRALLRKWMTPETSTAEMQLFIDELLVHDR